MENYDCFGNYNKNMKACETCEHIINCKEISPTESGLTNTIRSERNNFLGWCRIVAGIISLYFSNEYSETGGYITAIALMLLGGFFIYNSIISFSTYNISSWTGCKTAKTWIFISSLNGWIVGGLAYYFFKSKQRNYCNNHQNKKILYDLVSVVYILVLVIGLFGLGIIVFEPSLLEESNNKNAMYNDGLPITPQVYYTPEPIYNGYDNSRISDTIEGGYYVYYENVDSWKSIKVKSNIVVDVMVTSSEELEIYETTGNMPKNIKEDITECVFLISYPDEYLIILNEGTKTATIEIITEA